MTRRSVAEADAAPSSGMAWDTAAPPEAGIAPDLSAKIEAGVQSGLISGLHSIVIARDGKIVTEAYFEGEDADWGRPIGLVTHGPQTLHDLRFVSKSIVSLLYGIALERGQVPSPDAPLLSQFPGYADLAKDPQRAAWTIAHALTMSLGTEWNEDIPYNDPANSEIQMEQAPDLLRYVLDRPTRDAPGERWVYNGGTSALLGALIERGSGQNIFAFAREALFAPLGISQVEWNTGRNGRHSAASGLRMTARDLARIGQMVLDDGKAGGRRIVPQKWLEQSLTPRLATGEGPSYGYQWWLGAAPVRAMKGNEVPWCAGFGNGGQRLFVMPAARLVMTAFFGNYDRMDSWKYPNRIWWEIVLPSLTRM